MFGEYAIKAHPITKGTAAVERVTNRPQYSIINPVKIPPIGTIKTTIEATREVRDSVASLISLSGLSNCGIKTAE